MSLRRTIAKDGTYVEVLLAFLDVLGFGELLDSDGTESPETLLQLFEITYSSQHDWPPSVLHRRVISDSVIIWTTTDAPVGTLALLTVAAELQQNLFRRGVLVRGSVVYGKHYTQRIPPLSQQSTSIKAVDDEIIISHALRNAVMLERTTASPRVFLDHSVQPRLKLAHDQYGDMMYLLYGRDHTGALVVSGLYGIPPLRAVTKSYPPKLLSEWWPEKDASGLAVEQRQQAEEFLSRQKKIIEEALGVNDLKIVEKWRYVAREHNIVVQQANVASGISCAHKVVLEGLTENIPVTSRLP